MLVRVRVRTGERREYVQERSGGGLDVAVREKAKEGRANSRALDLIAAHFGVSRKEVRIVSGHRRPHKMVRVGGAR